MTWFQWDKHHTLPKQQFLECQAETNFAGQLTKISSLLPKWWRQTMSLLLPCMPWTFAIHVIESPIALEDLLAVLVERHPWRRLPGRVDPTEIYKWLIHGVISPSFSLKKSSLLSLSLSLSLFVFTSPCTSAPLQLKHGVNGWDGCGIHPERRGWHKIEKPWRLRRDPTQTQPSRLRQ